MNNVYLYNTKIYQLFVKNREHKNKTYYSKVIGENFHDSIANNEKMETIIIRDLKLAFGSRAASEV